MKHQVNKHYIKQNEFDSLISLISSMAWNERSYSKSLGEMLKDFNFEPVLKNINLDFSMYFLKSMNMKDVDFFECQFFGTINSLKIQGNIKDSLFSNFHCMNCQFESGTVIEGSTFKSSVITKSTFDQVVFENNVLNYTELYQDTLNQSSFINNSFYGDQFWNIDCNNITAINNNVTESDINLALSMDGFNVQERMNPIIGLFGDVDELGDFSNPGFLASEPYLRITESGSIPLLITQVQFADYLSHHINYFDLKKEINDVIQNINPNAQPNSIAQYVLQADYPGIQFVNAYAKEYAARLDGLWIPGGPDVYPGFYSTESLSYSSYGDDIIGDIFELAIINEMLAFGKPILGVCHGAQILNVYFGGTLLQHVDGQYGNQPIEVLKHTGRLGGVIEGDIVMGYSAHHQAVDILADPLEKVAEYDGILKAAQGKSEPVWLTQFHPEFLVDDNNKKILDSFFDEAKRQRHDKLEIIELADVLDNSNVGVANVMVHTPYIPQILPQSFVVEEFFG